MCLLAKGVKSELEQDVLDVDGGTLLRDLCKVVGDNIGLLNKDIAGVVCQLDTKDGINVHSRVALFL